MLITETEGPGNLQNVCCFITQNGLDEMVVPLAFALLLDHSATT